ncbi:MAG: NAD-dependent DNA ligase LigA [Metamycoplasmataceae bacterium]|uniref:NAD-dependent DNA ligase LigA n=1 Tax=Mycoplasmopsis lipophila TaxID=2117 RepID=UPI00387349DA
MNIEIKNKILQLTKKIWEWNKQYYQDNNPTVDDLVYDEALKELEELEKKYPEYMFPNSPTQHLGSFADSKFKKVIHKNPMLSLAKAYNFEDIIKYIDNLKKIVPEEKLIFSLEPKIDGLSLGLIYENGYLIKALTRGNGIEGEDVTENIYAISSIPKIINYSKHLEVRGEVFFKKKDFKTINNNLEKNNLQKFANARNAASGTLRQLDYKIVEKRNLSAFFYEIQDPLSHNIFKQNEALTFLKTLNIPTNNFHQIVEFDDLENEILNFTEIKNQLDYDADGLVIKLNDLNYWDKLGKTSKFPHHSIAYKYELESSETNVINIFATVGRTGKITYVANLEPVELNQTMVSAATLHNYNFIKDLKVNIGDKVKIIKAGEIIPKVVDVVKHKNDNVIPFKKILLCPGCKSQLKEFEDNVDQFCINPYCEEKEIKKIIHFASREAFNINTLGEKNIRLFYKLGYLKKIEDLFVMYKHKEELEKIPNMGKKSIEKLLNNIEEVKNISFHKTLYSLGIKHIGIRASKLISKEVNSFKELINYDSNQFINIVDIGPKSVESLITYLKNNKEFLFYLDEYLNYEQKENKTNKLENLIFVITGTLSKPRNYFEKDIENNGGKISNSVSKKTSYLLCGENPGSKLIEAQKYNIKVIGENEFKKLLEK